MSASMSNVLVTGANRGIGLGFVKEYLSQGCHVIAASRSISKELQSLKEDHSHLHHVEMDVTNEKSMKAAFENIQNKVSSLDRVINNAGRMGHVYDSIQNEFEIEDCTLTLQTNTVAPLFVAKYSLELLKNGDKPKIIQISSGLGSIADNTGGYYIYRASKAGLNMINKTLAIELTPLKITCVAICPGWVRTDMGGPQAPLTVDVSVKRMVDTIEKLTIEQTGSYIQRTGSAYPY